MSPRDATKANTTKIASHCRSQRTRIPRITKPENKIIRRLARIAERSLNQINQIEIIRNKSHSLAGHKEIHDPNARTTKTPAAKLSNATSEPSPQMFSRVNYIASKSSSSSECSRDIEPNSEDEAKPLSTDNVHLTASNVVEVYRKGYDIRCKARNQAYVLDRVVFRDKEEDGEDWETERKRSVISTSSEDTLFVPEIKVKKKRAEGYDEAIGLKNSVDEWSSEDVAEHISDAIVLFSRRCNKDGKPLVLRITKAIMRNKEVGDVLDRAVRLVLGMCTEMNDGSVVWRIVPKVVSGIP